MRGKQKMVAAETKVSTQNDGVSVGKAAGIGALLGLGLGRDLGDVIGGAAIGAAGGMIANEVIKQSDRKQAEKQSAPQSAPPEQQGPAEVSQAEFDAEVEKAIGPDNYAGYKALRACDTTSVHPENSRRVPSLAPIRSQRRSRSWK